MQLDNDSGKRQYDRDGNTMAEKYIPTLESIGNDKEAARSASLVLSLFDPSAFKIKSTDDGLEVARFYSGGHNRLRQLYVLKNSFGAKNQAFNFVYYGESNKWIEIIHSAEELRSNPDIYYEYYGLNAHIIKGSNLSAITQKYTKHLL